MSIADEVVTDDQINGEETPLFDQLLQERKDPFVTSSHLKGAIHDARNWEPEGPDDDYWCGWYAGRVDTPEQELQRARMGGGRPGGDDGDREVLPRRSRPGTRTTARSASGKNRKPRTKSTPPGSGGDEASADRPDGAGSDSGVQAAPQEGS